MNAINKKMLVIGVALLLSACAHYPRQHEYYPGNNAYSSGYTIMHRNYYGERPDHYDNGHGQGNVHFPHHQYRQNNSQSRWGNDYSRHQHQQDRNREHPLSHENSRRHDDNGDNHNNNIDRRNRHQQFTGR